MVEHGLNFLHILAWALTLNWGNLNYNHASLGVSHYSDSFVTGLLISGDKQAAQNSDKTYSTVDVGFFLGKAFHASDDNTVHLSYGIQGDYRHVSNLARANIKYNPYAVGPYVGITYIPADTNANAQNPHANITVFARISPLMYAAGANNDTDGKRDKSWHFASNIVIGMGYAFG